MDKPTKLAIDGDLIAYKAASVAQKSYIIVTNKKTGGSRRFDTRTKFYGHHAKKAGGWLGELNKERLANGKKAIPLSLYEITDEKEVFPASHACKTAKDMVINICKAAKANIKDVEIYMSGKENFRDNVATIYPYKGDREQEKPVHLQAVKDYFVNKFNAVYTEGYEADDKLSMLAYSGEAIQCSTDKDQVQTQGWIFDYDKMEAPLEVKEGVGRLWEGKTEGGASKVRGLGFKHLCFQMLVGDSVDSIKPRFLCKASYGEKTAFKDLKNIRTKKLCLITVLDKYKEWYPEPVTYPHWRTGEEITKNYFEIASEMFTLLYMLKSVDDKTTLKDLCEELEVEYSYDN